MKRSHRFASRRVKEVLVALLSLAGVALISVGPNDYFDLVGHLAGLLAAICFGIYTLFAVKIGKQGSGRDGIGLSVTVSAILTTPFALAHLTAVTMPHWGLIALAALVGVAIPYAVDTRAGRITSTRVIGTLFAVDPARGALIGFLLLNGAITPRAVVGVFVVMLAGAFLAWGAPGRTHRR